MRRWRVLGVLIGLGLVGMAVVALRPTGPRPSLATFALVHEGMTREQVYAGVGGMPGDYSDGYTVPANRYTILNDSRQRPEVWAANDAFLVAYFDTDGRVCGRVILGGRRIGEPPLWQRILDQRLW